MICFVIGMHCRFLKYFINTIKTSWQKTVVTVYPQLAENPEKGPSGSWGAWAQLAVTVWPQGIIRLMDSPQVPLPGKPKGTAESVIRSGWGQIPEIIAFVRVKSWETKKGQNRLRRDNSQSQSDQQCWWQRRLERHWHVLRHNLGRTDLWTRTRPQFRVSMETGRTGKSGKGKRLTQDQSHASS